MPELSLVITVLNEEENIAPLLASVRAALSGLDYEVILVDDGSTDQTKKRILEEADDRSCLVELRKNFGQSNAMMAGIDHSSGSFIALLDGDLQNDPLDIPTMLDLLKQGEWDMVAGNRKNRKDGFILRKLPSSMANALIRRMTGVYINDYGCTLKVIRREIAAELGLYGELHRFIPVLARIQGARITQVDVRHHARIHGKSKYGISRSFKVLSDLLLVLYLQKYRQKPMHLFGTTGIIAAFSGAAILVFLLINLIIGNAVADSLLLIPGFILLFGGIQLIATGLVAETAMRTYYESQAKKPYKVKRVMAGKNN